MPNRLAIAAHSFTPLEWPRLAGALLCQRLVRHARLTAYLESWGLFREAQRRGIRSERRGRLTCLKGGDDDTGPYEVVLRRGSSDLEVFRQCLIDKQYEPLVRLARACLTGRPVSLIVDAGANVGLSALYLARAFPGARVLCLEADAENLEVCRHNVEANALRRVELLHQALWSGEEALEVTRALGDSREWARAVRRPASSSGQPIVPGVSIPGLLSAAGADAIDVLKIDIEGAEKEVFRNEAAAERWLALTRVLAVEIHDTEGQELILPKLARNGFLAVRVGELTLAARQELVPSGAPSLAALTMPEKYAVAWGRR